MRWSAVLPPYCCWEGAASACGNGTTCGWNARMVPHEPLPDHHFDVVVMRTDTGRLDPDADAPECHPGHRCRSEPVAVAAVHGAEHQRAAGIDTALAGSPQHPARAGLTHGGFPDPSGRPVHQLHHPRAAVRRRAIPAVLGMETMLRALESRLPGVGPAPGNGTEDQLRWPAASRLLSVPSCH